MVVEAAELFTDTVHFSDVLWRNIKGIRVSQDLFDDLSDDVDDQAFAVAAESLGKPAAPAPLLSRPFDYTQAVIFPFDQVNWQQSRYSDGSRFGIWYGSDCLETTVHESVHHWIRFLVDAPTRDPGEEIVGERRVYTADCDGLLADLRGKERTDERLVHPADYTLTQRVGRYAYDQGLNGMLVPSARYAAGFNAALLNPRILDNPQDRCYLTYRWRVGTELVRVERRPGRRWMSVSAGSAHLL